MIIEGIKLLDVKIKSKETNDKEVDKIQDKYPGNV